MDPRKSETYLKAVEIAKGYKKYESALIDVLIQIRAENIHALLGYSNLIQFIAQELGLSESVAANFNAVVTAIRKVPELKTKIEAGSISLTNARTIAPILTQENKTQWLACASDLSQRHLQKEIKTVFPEMPRPEKANHVSRDRVRLEFDVSEKEMLRFRKMQTLVGQKRRKNVSLQETLSELMDLFEYHEDPVAKAKRAAVRKNGSVKPTDTVRAVALQQHARQSWGRTPYDAETLHGVNLRDQRRCAYEINGKRCNETRFIEIHHIKPVSMGGTNTLENLQTLCSTHHALIHDH